MNKYVIRGGRPLKGQIEISGAKNAAVAMIPAAILVDGVCRIENIPQISDAVIQLSILKSLGADVRAVTEHTMDIDCTGIQSAVADLDLMQKLRASYYLIGALLGKFGEATVALPGGCNFGGVRPIDQHIKGFTAMGAEVEVKNGLVIARAEGGKLRGANIYLDVVSVGATINLMLAAVLACGRTVIENAAREPHIVDVANFLNSMGADIRGAGTNVIKIRGVERLSGGFYSIHLGCISSKLEEMGVEVIEGEDCVLVRRRGPLRRANLKTQPYPGFPTDMQPQMTTVLALAKGTSRVTEGVWDNRYKYVDELAKMGATIRVDGRTAIVDGVDHLTGAHIKAWDLRAGAAMVIAGLCADGVTDIEGIEYIERGYENLIEKLTAVGADIKFVEDTEPEETVKRAV